MSNRALATSSSDELEGYLQMDLPPQHVANMLRAEGKEEKEIDAFIEKYNESRHKIRKYIKKFIEKIERKYGDLDIPELMKKGMKFAQKHNFSKAEERKFINQVMTGDVDTPYVPFQEMAYTDMSKFLGFSTLPSFMNIKATDHAVLEEIATLFEESRGLHTAVKNNLSVYKSCAPEAITGRYDRDKHNITSFVHPVIVALFLSRISSLEKRMLISNIGRMIVQRSSHLLRKYHSYSSSVTKTELMCDLELMHDIAKDPNSMNYFSEETPLSNLLKRFKIQVELYKNVLSLRDGKYYSKSENDSALGRDYVSGLTQILQSYEWTYFDSPEFYHVQDEGTYLRKLLSVFSLRPTFTQLSSLMTTSTMGYSNFGASRLTFVNTPIINVRLPRNVFGGNQVGPNVRLSSALSQTENFIENKMIIPKHKMVIHSRELLFFYANRRYHTINFTNMDVSLRYLNLPGTVSNITGINKTEIHFDETFPIGNERFFLRSVVVLNNVPKSEFATTGCSAIVKSQFLPNGQPRGGPNAKPVYFYYNPVTANLMFVKNNLYTTNSPIMALSEHSGPNKPGFYDLARKLGTIYVYSDKEDNKTF
jgi:hypothetical protein